MTLNLSPEMEKRIVLVAQSQGVTPNEYVARALETALDARDAKRRQEAIALLESWRDPALAAEQKETGEYLIRVLDEDRPSDRKLFPPELKGISW